MKCGTCGYERSFDWETDKQTGDEDFVKIEGTFLTKKQFDYGKDEVHLFACPKCDTVKLVRYL